MPGGNVFHIGHAFALDGMGDDDGGPSVRGAGAAEAPPESAAMSWPSISATAQPKARHLAASGSSRMMASLRVVALQLVVVDQGAEIVELVMRARTSRLPTLRLPAIRRRPAACRPAPAFSAASGPSPCRARRKCPGPASRCWFRPRADRSTWGWPWKGCSACAGAARLCGRRSRNRRPTAYSAGAAWPLDRTKRSRSGSSTAAGQTFISAP